MLYSFSRKKGRRRISLNKLLRTNAKPGTHIFLKIHTSLNPPIVKITELWDSIPKKNNFTIIIAVALLSIIMITGMTAASSLIKRLTQSNQSSKSLLKVETVAMAVMEAQAIKGALGKQVYLMVQEDALLEVVVMVVAE